MTRLIAEAALPAALGLLLTLIVFRSGGLAPVVAILATWSSQGGLLIGSFAVSSRLHGLPYRERLRKALYAFIPFGATSVVAVVILIYLGLGAEGAPADFFVGPVIVIGLLLGASILVTPAVVLDDADLGGVLVRAATRVWPVVASVLLGVAYVAAMLGAVWLGPDQLVGRGVVPESATGTVRAVAGWLAVALLAIPFWWLVTHLYLALSRGRSARSAILS